MNTARVGDIAEQIRGVTYSKGEATAEPGPDSVALLRAGNITDSGIDLSDLTYVPRSRVSERQQIMQDDVLIAASSGSLSVVGKSARVTSPLEATFGAFCKVLRPRTGVHPGYFAHYFRTPEYRRYISSVAAGANINNLRADDLDRIELPLPPLPEQRRIATILDEADTLRQLHSRATAELRELRLQVARDFFKSAESRVPLGSYLLRSQNGLYKAQSDYGRGTRIVRIDAFDGVSPGFVRKLKRVELGPGELDRFRIHPGEILLNRVNALSHLGKSTLVPSLAEPTVFESNMMKLTPDTNKVLPSVLAAWLASTDARTQLKQRAKKAINQASVNQRDVESLEVPYLDAATQSALDVCLTELSVQAGSERERGPILDELFASLQYRAFRGGR